MGKRWSRKHKKAENKRKAQKPRKESWASVIPGNPKMEAYYALQGLHNHRWNATKGEFMECATDQEKEHERMEWLTSLRSMLPASFRIGTDVDSLVRERLELELDSHFVNTEMEIIVDKEEQEDTTQDKKQSAMKKIAPAKHIPYIPHAYQLSVDRKTIRRNPALEEFHEWLQAQTLCGHITRQETVSMIPPVVLSVEPHHKVLDMCAAPGSKTSQLLEIVSTFDGSNDLEPKGCVVANDSDPKRAYMLVHQLRRINSPAVLVTSCDAQFFPLLDGEGMFDRVLCDVPCSGDGTTRKNPGVWRHWSAIGALSLHPVQLGIALNGARLTKVGGYLCYSTCSMNPIENEAVVAELLRAADGSLELVDKRCDMPGLMARPGWTSWRVFRENKSRKQMKDHRKKNNAKMQARRKEWEEKSVSKTDVTKKGNENDREMDVAKDDAEEADDDEAMDPNKDHSGGPPPSWDEETLLARLTAKDVTEFKSFDEVPDEWNRSVRKTCFPPTQEEAAKFGLEKCLRCLPHDMDTGGFFVALLKKVKPISARAKREAMELAKEFRPEAVGNGELLPDSKRAKMENTTTIGANDLDTSVVVDDNQMETDSQVNDTFDGELKQSSDTKAPTAKSPFRGRGKSRGNLGNDYFVPLNDDIWKELDGFYGFTDTFPKQQFMARANGEAKTLFFLAEPIKDMIDRGIQERLTVINSGLKAFSKNNKDCKVLYRITQEGVHYVAPHMTKRKIVADLVDFWQCISVDHSMRLELFSEDFASAVKELDPGSFVVALKGYENDASKKLYIVMWRCRKDAVDCLVAKIEQEGMMSKLRAIPGYEHAEAAAKAAISG